MKKGNYKRTKSLILFVVIVILSFFVLLLAFGIIPISKINYEPPIDIPEPNNKPSIDIYKEIETLNEGRTDEYSISKRDWWVFRKDIQGALNMDSISYSLCVMSRTKNLRD